MKTLAHQTGVTDLMEIGYATSVSKAPSIGGERHLRRRWRFPPGIAPEWVRTERGRPSALVVAA